MLSKAASDIRPALIHEVESISELVFQSESTQPLNSSWLELTPILSF